MDFWNFGRFWLCASPFCKNICIFSLKMITNIIINLCFSLELCMNSCFCTKVKNSQNSLKSSNFLYPCAAPFYKVTKKFYWKFFRFTTYFDISRLELGQRKIFLPPDHAKNYTFLTHFVEHNMQLIGTICSVNCVAVS